MSTNDAKGFITSEFEGSDDGRYFALYRENRTISSTSETWERITYFYVDKDCTISSNGRTETDDGFTDKTNPFRLALKAGWNTVYEKRQDSYSEVSYTSTTTYSLANPNSLKWVLGGPAPGPAGPPIDPNGP